jgi:hypothetical protein
MVFEVLMLEEDFSNRKGLRPLTLGAVSIKILSYRSGG